MYIIRRLASIMYNIYCIMQCIGAWYVNNPTLGQYNPVACTSLSPCCTQALCPLFFTAGVATKRQIFSKPLWIGLLICFLKCRGKHFIGWPKNTSSVGCSRHWGVVKLFGWSKYQHQMKNGSHPLLDPFAESGRVIIRHCWGWAFFLCLYTLENCHLCLWRRPISQVVY